MANKKKPEGRLAKIRKYFRDIASEFRKIVWPNGKQVWNNTTIVLVTVLIFAIFIWVLDYGFNAFRDWGIGALTGKDASASLLASAGFWVV